LAAALLIGAIQQQQQQQRERQLREAQARQLLGAMIFEDALRKAMEDE